MPFTHKGLNTTFHSNRKITRDYPKYPNGLH